MGVQGGRKHMEDSAIPYARIGPGVALTAIFDGHGGDLTANLCASSEEGFHLLMRACGRGGDASLNGSEESARTYVFSESVPEGDDGSGSDGSMSPALPWREERRRTYGEDLATFLRNRLEGTKRRSVRSAFLLYDEFLRQRLTPPTRPPHDLLVTSGATAVVVTATGGGGGGGGGVLTAYNVGDSRAYVVRKEAAPAHFTTHALTADHKPELPAELARIQMEQDAIVPGRRVFVRDGRGEPRGGLAVARALGDFGYKGRVGYTPAHQPVTALPSVRTCSQTEADVFLLLATDGLWDTLDPAEAARCAGAALAVGAPPEQAAAYVLDQAAAKRTRDNTTVTICMLRDRHECFPTAASVASEWAEAERRDGLVRTPSVESGRLFMLCEARDTVIKRHVPGATGVLAGEGPTVKTLKKLKKQAEGGVWEGEEEDVKVWEAAAAAEGGGVVVVEEEEEEGEMGETSASKGAGEPRAAAGTTEET